jgi:hypothetical protein
MAAPHPERRRIARGPDLAARLAMRWVVWVHVYVLVLAFAVAGPSLLAYLYADGMVEEAEAAARLATIGNALALPAVVLAVIAAAHGGYLALQASSYVDSLRAPLECLRADLSRQQRLGRDVLESARVLTRAADRKETPRREVGALAHGVLDSAERLTGRPGSSVASPADGGRDLHPESDVASALAR